MNLKDFSLMEDHDDHYVIGHPKGKSMKIAKAGLSDKAQGLISNLKQERHLAEGTPDEPLPPPPTDTPENTPILINTSNPQMPDSMINPGIENASQPPQPNVTAAAEQGTATDAGPSPSQQMQQQVPSPMASPDLQKAIGSAKGAIQSGVTAQKKAGAQEAGTERELAENLQDIPTADQVFDKYQTKDAELEKSFKNGEIDPNHYVNNMGLGSKITSSIGMLLSGLGSGLSGQPNLAMQKLNQSIANDIDAQKNEQSKKMNLWKMNREMLGNDTQADLATQNQLLNVAKAKIASAQAGALGPMAQQNAAQALLGLNQQQATNNWMRSRIDGSGSPGTEQQHIGELQVMQQVRPDLYKDMEGKYIPGMGTTRVAVTAEDKKALGAYDEIQKAVNDAKAFQTTQVGPLGTLPFTANNDIANSKKNAIALGLNKLNGLSRLNEIEYNNFMNSVNNIGSFNSGRANAQLDELSNQIQRKKQSEMQALGVMPFKKASSNQQAVAWAKANPTDPRAAQIMQMTGGQ